MLGSLFCPSHKHGGDDMKKTGDYFRLHYLFIRELAVSCMPPHVNPAFGCNFTLSHKALHGSPVHFRCSQVFR